VPKPQINWSTDDVPGNEKTDAWQALLCSSYQDWSLSRRLPATFNAHIRKYDFAGLGIVEAACDPCAGQRTRTHVRRDEELYVGVQLTNAGREHFKIGDSRVEVGSGDVVVWTTEHITEFEVVERLHKVTLVIPWTLLRERLNGRKQPPLGGKVESRAGVGALLAAHLLALSNEVACLDQKVQGSVCRSTLELLEAVFSDQQSMQSPNTSVVLLRRIQDYILQQLHDETLNPTKIAAANHISLRYLHLLFKLGEATVSEWILDRRLQACKLALEDSAFAQCHVAEIAYRWGFNSSSHFCRVFKDKYGCNPSEVRRLAGVAAEIEIPTRFSL
jgi:AraC-like DNA-binding protein